ncbi:AraC family transcriptional regulator [Rhodococcoides kyotonense]|uniref:AraC-type DNA-binding protein n=1 Tax=Rhodococcoides kyotonense TaxID=398843 RepID=A0A239EYL8_9NOCA|nr:AraC family transcriptional regulator [Rhodococcus kyotonensis]SNS49561.1 AraC-type DNA-binding protein [Rhodococcus kyotonensis]
MLPDTGNPAPTLWLWAGQAVYLGPSLKLDFHAGSVLCFAVGVDAPFTLRDDRSGCWTVRSATIGPRTTHKVESHGERMLFGYFDPGASRATTIVDRMTARHGGIGLTHDAEAELLQLANSSDPDPRAMLTQVTGLESRCVDERIVDAMARLRDKPGAMIAAPDMAAAVNLSTSRFLHLFSAETGTSFRRYRLWARMLHVGVAVSDGSDLTGASIEAGFASPSHFSDSFHTLFGMSAAALLAGGVRIVVVDR